jgi:hypothetical protein
MKLNKYLYEVKYGAYKPLSKELFKNIQEEGFVSELEEVYGLQKLTKNNFKYIVLSLTKKDKQGLMNLRDETENKFNLLDIRIKDMQKGYPTLVDFIDYNKGAVYIVGLDTSSTKRR